MGLKEFTGAQFAGAQFAGAQSSGAQFAAKNSEKGLTLELRFTKRAINVLDVKG